MGYITKDGQVVSLSGLALGELKQGFLINKENQLVGRGNRDFMIRDNSYNVLGELTLSGNLVNFDGETLGILNAKGEINNSAGRFVAKAHPLQYYHAQTYTTKLYDSFGKFIGYVDAQGNIRDEQGNLIGKLRDNGDIVDLDGNIIGQTGSDRYAYEIRPLKRREWEDAMQLAWDTFLIYEAPDYSLKGVHNFKSFVRDPLLKKMFTYGEYIAIGAFIERRMIGILGVRNTNHVSLLFVDQEYHRRGVARALMRRYFRDARHDGITYVTVNSSPYAVGFYHKIGFVNVKDEP